LTLEGALDDIALVNEKKGKKIFIKGNHDFWWSSIKKFRDALPPTTVAIQNDAIKIGNYVICGSRCWAVPELEQKSAPEDLKIFEREILRLELSLNSAEKLRKEGDKLIVMTHFPPFNSRFEDSAYTKIISEHNACAVIYGHLHGAQSRSKMIVDKNGIPYYLTSCDKLNNILLEIDI
ncbi:MAG: metallophosphoesterase, partial [Bacillota bacterium]